MILVQGCLVLWSRLRSLVSCFTLTWVRHRQVFLSVCIDYCVCLSCHAVFVTAVIKRTTAEGHRCRSSGSMCSQSHHIQIYFPCVSCNRKGKGREMSSRRRGIYCVNSMRLSCDCALSLQSTYKHDSSDKHICSRLCWQYWLIDFNWSSVWQTDS